MYFDDDVKLLFMACGPFVDLLFLQEHLVPYFEVVLFAFWVSLLFISSTEPKARR